jgi:hypothetical protein
MAKLGNGGVRAKSELGEVTRAESEVEAGCAERRDRGTGCLMLGVMRE